MRIKYYIKLAWKDIKTQPGIYLPYALMISICLCFQYIAGYMNIHSNYEVLKMGKCLVYYSNNHNKNDKFIEFIEDALKYIEKNNMTVVGDIYFNGVKLKYEDGSKGFIIYIPIE